MPTSDQLAHLNPIDGDGSNTVSNEDGTATTVWPDGSTRVDYADGSFMVTFPDASVLNAYVDGTRTLNANDGSSLDPLTGERIPPEDGDPIGDGTPFAYGIYVGLRIPIDANPTGPPYDESAMSDYVAGVDAARAFRLEKDAEYQGPAVDVPPPDGVPLEELEARQREILEVLFHKHMPHTELPEFEPVLPAPFDVPVGP